MPSGAVRVVENPFCSCRPRRQGPCFRALCVACGDYLAIHAPSRAAALDWSEHRWPVHACNPERSSMSSKLYLTDRFDFRDFSMPPGRLFDPDPPPT